MEDAISVSITTKKKGKVIMEEMKIMLTMLGLIVVGVIAWIIFRSIRNNLAKNSKNISQKAEIMMKKDMSSKYARCTFYMNNDYDNGYSQSEWMQLFKKNVIDKGLDKDSKEYAEAVAPFINAIVVSEIGHYVRRGMEFIENKYQIFTAGKNDNISLNYFVEPYEYVKNEVRRTSSTQTRTTTVSHNQPSDRLTDAEKREINRAEHNYNYAVRMASSNPNSEIRASDEKRAYAEYMRVLAKYAGKK